MSAIHEASRQLVRNAQEVEGALDVGNHAEARRCLRELMSTAGRLLPKLTAIQDLLDGGYAAAEVDRALRITRPIPPEVPGQETLVGEPRGSKGTRRGRTPRK